MTKSVWQPFHNPFTYNYNLDKDNQASRGSVVKLSKKNFFLKKFFYSVSKLSKKTICYSVSGVSTQLRN